MCVYIDRKDVSYWPSLCSSRNLEKWAFWWTIKREARARPSGRSGRPLCRLMFKLTKLCGGVPWLPSFLVTAWELFVIIFALCGNSIVVLFFFSFFRVFAIFSWLFLRNNRWSSSRPRFFRCHSIILNKWCPQELSIIAVLVLLGHVPGCLAAISFPRFLRSCLCRPDRLPWDVLPLPFYLLHFLIFQKLFLWQDVLLEVIACTQSATTL